MPGSDIFARLVRAIYRSDTPMNVCPSIHVFNSVTLLLAYYRSRIFDAPRRRWMRPAAMVLCMSITLSTMLLKQHSVIDVVFGLLLALLLDQAATVFAEARCSTASAAYRKGCNRKYVGSFFAKKEPKKFSNAQIKKTSCLRNVAGRTFFVTAHIQGCRPKSSPVRRAFF